MRPHRWQPTRLRRPWDSQARTLEWVAISFSNAWKWKVKVKSLSRVWLLATPWTVAHQAPPFMGFSRQEYWSGVPLPSPVTNLDSVLKSRDITLPDKCPDSQSYGYSIALDVRVGPKEDWAPKEWCFQIEVLEKTLRVPWTARRSNQSILKEINPEYSLKGLMLKLNLQYFGHLMRRADSLEKTWWWEWLRAGGEGDDRGWDGWMASPTQWTWVWANSGRLWRTEEPGVL